MRTDELFMLWAMVNKCVVNTRYYLLSHLASVATQDKGKIGVGEWLVSLLKRLERED